MKVITRENYFTELASVRRPYHDQYKAMYASDLQGIVLDPLLMRIPVDDHMVHRGDGAFEMCKCVQRGIYNLGAHIKRLFDSMQALGLVLPVPRDALPSIVLETVRASGLDDAALRIYVSRGPGSFGVSPADCPVAHLYVVVSTLSPGFMELHPEGARVGISRVPLKPGVFATMKHCNYLPNVLMKQEALSRGLDFTLGLDHEGYLAEGPTENFGIITKDRRLVFPQTDRVLAGTTMMRVLELAKALCQAGELQSAGFGRIHPQDVLDAAEMIIVGTTTDVTHVCRFEDRCWGTVGPLTQVLRAALLEDVRSGTLMRVSLDE
jgi:branched-subunit amino acid aminotransferase/4-amino-4-deoxychorismate lyase